jgi:flagellar biogenesis protein FliO
MQRIGAKTMRAFKTLAGVEKDEPIAAWVFTLYGFLFCLAFVLVAAWLVGPPA